MGNVIQMPGAGKNKAAPETEKLPVLRKLENVPALWPTGFNASAFILEDEYAKRARLGDQAFVIDVAIEVPSFGNLYDMCGLERKTEELDFFAGITFYTDKCQTLDINKDNVIYIGDVASIIDDRLYFVVNRKTGDFEVDFTTGTLPNGTTIDEDSVLTSVMFPMASKEYIEGSHKNYVTNPIYRESVTKSLIHDYDKLTEEQQKTVSEQLEKLIYLNKRANAPVVHALIRNLKTAEEKGDTDEITKHQFVVPLKSAEEGGGVDIDAFTRLLCPKFGAEPLDMSTIEMGADGLPVLNEEDIKRLGFIGLKKDQISQMLSNSRSAITMAREDIEPCTAYLEENKADYDIALSELAKLDTSSLVNIKEKYKQYIDTIHQYRLNEKQLESSKGFVDDQIFQIANFQIISRVNIKGSIDDGSFTSAHTFNALAIYNQAMAKKGYVGEGVPNYGPYLSYLRYIIGQTKKILNDEPTYYDEILFRFITGRDEKTIKGGRSVETMAEAVIRSLVRTEDLKSGLESTVAVEKERANAILLERVKGRIDYMYTLGGYPMSIAARFNKSLVEGFTFGDTNDAQIVSDWEKVNAAYLEKKWALPADVEAKQAEVNALVAEITGYLKAEESYDKLVGYLTYAREVSLSEHADAIGKQKPKNLSTSVTLLIAYSYLMEAVKYISAFLDKEVLTLNAEGKETTEKISKEVTLSLIARFFIETSSNIVLVASATRVRDDIIASAEKVNSISERDASTFFSTFFDSLIIPIEVLERGEDTPEKIDDFGYVISQKKAAAVGGDAVKMLYGGLVGYTTEEKTQTKIGAARTELISLSTEYAVLVLTMVRNIIKEIVTFDNE